MKIKCWPTPPPSPLAFNSGDKVENVMGWENKRQLEILQLSESEVYGETPNFSGKIKTIETEVDTSALNDKVIRKQISIFLMMKIKDPEWVCYYTFQKTCTGFFGFEFLWQSYRLSGFGSKYYRSMGSETWKRKQGSERGAGC